MRNQVNSINCAWVELDESEFCKKCSPNITAPRINIIIRAEDEPHSRIVKGIDYWDISLIEIFCNELSTIEKGYGATAPLTEYIERLEALLGVHCGD